MTDSQNLHLYGKIEKFDAAADGSLMVSGIASTECVDRAGEIITADAIRKALPDYLRCGTVREMHQPIAAGRPISAFVDDDGRTHFTAHIVDRGTIDKIRSGVLKGFSIGAKKVASIGNKITELLLGDISVVDRPCNPECLFEIIKFDNNINKSMKCKYCDGDKSEGHECEGMKEKKADMKKVDDLVAAVDAITKSLAALKPAEKKADEPTLADVLKAFNDLKETQKTSDSFVFKMDGKDVTLKGEDIMKHMARTEDEIKKSNELVSNNERKGVLEKMAREARVAFNESGVAYKADELLKVDLNILKVLANNAPVLPTEARAIYKADGGKNSLPPEIKGSDRIQKAWEADYSDLALMRLKFPIGN